MTVGPKGQVVIPSLLRKALKIIPGSKVVIRLEGERLIVEKQKIDTVEIFENIAKNGKSLNEIPSHSYEKELSGRNKS
ncbi:MAG: AbrB/MazE/SpoVT family DNA-binding domain-containing protein [Thermoplasmataceae archaeon]